MTAVAGVNFDGALDHIGAVVLATGALGTAAAALVDASRGVFASGGVSAFGYRHLKPVYTALSPALRVALGQSWEAVLRGHWVNGAPRDQQIGTVVAMVRLGLTQDNPQAILDNLLGGEGALSVADYPLKAADLGRAVAYLKNPEALSPAEEADHEEGYAQAVESQQAFDALGRFDALVRARLEAAFDLADHEYRGRVRLTAAVASIVLSLICAAAYVQTTAKVNSMQVYALAAVLGLLAMPLAPIAKDVTSALKAASGALKAATGKA